MNIPKHIAIIMDGNGRWAKAKGLPRAAGHKKGVDRVKEVVSYAKEVGVEVVTVFAFSTENWNRPKNEINTLFSYLNTFLGNYSKDLMKEDIRFKVIGRRKKFPSSVIKSIEKAEDMTKNNRSMVFNVALDYGGRWDIVEAVKNICSDYASKKESIDSLTEEDFSSYLALGQLPDPELLIRTSGEERISNFLIWNLAYSEFYFTKDFWPDFDKSQFIKAINNYSRRKRRFGKVDE